MSCPFFVAAGTRGRFPGTRGPAGTGSDSIRERRIVEGETLVRLRSVKSALMSVLLTGELRVTPDTEAA